MKVTSPSEKLGVEKIVEQFEQEFKNEEINLDYYFLVISGEYPRGVCDEIEQIYKDAGWKKVLCRTSSERGERPDLTGLQLWR